MKKIDLKHIRTSFDQKRAVAHQKDLHMEVPKDYFTASKKQILAKTVYQHKKEKKLTLPKFYRFSAAVAVLLCIGASISFYQQKSLNALLATNEVENELLLSALFENDTELENLTIAYMIGDLQNIKKNN